MIYNVLFISEQKLKDFTPYKTMDECIAAGGKTQKTKTASKKKAA